ncbi:MAG TPA: IPT/TIG domain-containing protein [Gaiellaceae bacterium]
MARVFGCALVLALVLSTGGTATHAGTNAADTARSKAAATLAAFIQQGDKLTGGGETGNGYFGVSIALSADGSTALVGGPIDDGNRGAAWVFTRSGSTWSQQGAKLTGSGATGAAGFGRSVALSDDGDTAIVGGPQDSGRKGAAWVFTRSGTAWNQQGAKLSGGGETGNGEFGTAVALSANGSTALVGGSADDGGKGAAWVFTRAGNTWTQQGAKLTGAGETGNGELGRGVALSSDGSTAIAGGPLDNGGTGALWVFTRSGTTWTPQGGKLTGTGATGAPNLGTSVALSADGDTLLAGGAGDSQGRGAAWVFTRSGGTWTQQGSKLTATVPANAGFGFAVDLAADGNSALIGSWQDEGSKGSAFSFSRSGGSWSQQGDKLTGAGASGPAKLGYAVALSNDGKTALAGGPYDDGYKGAAWVFSSTPPVVSSISPGSGPAGGGTVVTIKGSGFTGATEVKFGSATSPLVKVVSDGELSVVSPPGTGTVDVTVTGPGGTSATSATSKFTFTGGATTATTTTTKTASTPSTATITKIVFARVIGQGRARLLTVRIRVSGKGKVKLRLLRNGVGKLQRTYPVRKGVNELMAVVPRSVQQGTYRVQLTLTDGTGRQRVYRSAVRVPR